MNMKKEDEVVLVKKEKKSNPKTIATASLITMGVGFAATIPFDHSVPVKFLQGGFEAGLVGGLADWFAVTALFRHPLNIPIPHTALLPKNRKRITKAILNMVEQELLNKESLISKLDNVKFSEIVLGKIEEFMQEKEFQDMLDKTKEKIIAYIDENDFAQIKKEIRTIIQQKEKEVSTPKIVNLVIDKVLEEKIDEKTMDLLIVALENKINEEGNRKKINEFVFNLIEKKAQSGLMKIALLPMLSLGKEKIETMIQSSIDEALFEVKKEDSDTRFKIKHALKMQIVDLKENEDVLKNLQAKREQLLNKDTYEKVIDNVVMQIKNQLKEKINEKDLNYKIKLFLTNQLAKLKENKAFLENTDARLKETIGKIIENNHEKIGKLIQENMDKLSNEELTELLEDKIGKELAWIRVNGALCGFLIGLGLTAIKMFV